MPSTASRAPILLLCAALATVLAYWLGLSGPFLFDDFPNLLPVERWMRGEVDWTNVVFTHPAALGRPLSMASFLANAATTGLGPLPFKVTNLLIHLACGALIALLLRQLLARVPDYSPPAATTTACWLALLWLLLPIHVSTVLYVVQRMAQLSTLFMLLAVLAYVAGRVRLEEARGRPLLWLFGAVPLLTVAAALSKENGVLVPLLCGVLELTLWSGKRPRMVRAFYALFLALPAVLGVVAMLARPELLLQGYVNPDFSVNRDFTIVERLMTQPSVLLAYLRAIVLPAGPRMGLFHDDFPVAQSLLEPWWTLPAILALALAIGVAIRVRRSRPLVAAGIGFFLAGHALESSVVPLEIYFEHRNYLPSAGLLLALAGVLVPLRERLRDAASPGIVMLLAIAVPAVYGVATFARAGVWSSEEALLEQALQRSPDSRRVRILIASRAMEGGDVAAATRHVDHLWQKGNAGDRAVASLWRVIIACDGSGRADPALIADIGANAPDYIHINAMAALEIIARRVESGRCPAIDRSGLADALGRWLDASRQDRHGEAMWRARLVRSRFLAAAGRMAEARSDAALAWLDSGKDFSAGAVVFRIEATLQRYDVCHALLPELERAVARGDLEQRGLVERFRAFLAEKTAAPP